MIGRISRLTTPGRRLMAWPGMKSNSSRAAFYRTAVSSVSKNSVASNSTSSLEQVGELAAALQVRLTPAELSILRDKLDLDGDGLVTRNEIDCATKKLVEDRAARELCLGVIESPTSFSDRLGLHFIKLCDFGGTALFAIVGTQIAGDVGMNIIGSTLVGCLASCGGGTVNNLVYGSTIAKPGVFWVRDPRYLALAVAASVFTYYAWPAYCQRVYENDYVDLQDPDQLDKLHQLQVESEKSNSGAAKLKLRSRMTLVRHEVQHHFDTSVESYVLETLALAGFAVAAVHGAISMGLHPMVAATSGVTICFGGILRDVLCHRDIAIGSQSYALCTGAGSSIYVVMREMSLRGINAPLMARIILAVGTTIALRAFEYARGEPLLDPMHGRREMLEDEDH